MSDPNLGWLAAAFGVAWLVIGGYLIRLVRAQRQIERQLNDLAERDR